VQLLVDQNEIMREKRNTLKKRSADTWVDFFIVFVTICLITFGNGCKEKVNDGGVVSPLADISMTTPYVTTSDIASINECFSSSTNAPWGFVHNGIDISPDGNLKPFQTVSSGVVEEVRLWQNSISSNWQVNVRIKFNSAYSVEYAFEPFSAVQSDGQTQLNNISVSVGQTISEASIIGNLYTAGSGPHAHFMLMKNSVAICPEPYFTTAARDSVLNLIHKNHPTWNMCY
jgi:hypothetical protein